MLPLRCQSVLGLGVRYLSTSGSAAKAPARIHGKRRAPNTIRRVPPRQQQSSQVPPRGGDAPKSSNGNQDNSVSTALQQAAKDDTNGLLAPVHIPEDPQGILRSDHPAMHILDNSSIVVHRQIEMMNLMMGFEQANKYVINDAHGNVIGFLAEQEHGIGNAVARQTFRTHRSFTTHVFDKNEREVLRFHRPFSWISSRIRVYDALNGPELTYTSTDALSGTSTGSVSDNKSAQASNIPLSDMRVIGEAQQQWAPLRRKYNLFLHRRLDQDPSDPDTPQLTSGNLPLSSSTALQVADNANENLGFLQFASVDEPVLSWDFSLKSEDGRLIGSVNRNFAGFGREIFTDTGVYALRMDSVGLSAEPRHLISQTGKDAEQELAKEEARGMTLDQRAVMLATAVSVDFDYFSRQRHGAFGSMMPLWLPFPGGGVPAEGGAAGEAGAAGAEGVSPTSDAGTAPYDPNSPQSPTGGEDFYGAYPPSGGSSSGEQGGWGSWPSSGGEPPAGGGSGGAGGGGGGTRGEDGGSLLDSFFDL